jgi:hypothetical protein
VIRGRIVDLRRCINAHVYWRGPPGPTERYELWIRQLDGREFKITIQTQTMPARRGHAVSLILKPSVVGGRVLGVFNATTMDSANYMRTDPPPLLRVSEFVALTVAFVVMAAWFGDLGMVLFLVHGCDSPADGPLQPHDLPSTLESTRGTRAGRRSGAKRLETAA